MKYSNRILMMALIALGFALGSCDKTEPYDVTIPPPEAHFVGEKATFDGSVVGAPAAEVKLGTTDVASSDRTITYKVTSTSAVAGVNYTIASGNTGGTVTIPANQAIASIPVQVASAEYQVQRRDTLIFTIESPSLKPSAFLDTFRLIITGIAGPCDESNPTLATLLGDYDNTNELLGTGAYGPYTTSISSAVAAGATSATIIVENIFDDSWGPISFTLDWTDPVNRTTTVITNNAIANTDAGSLNAAYAGFPIAVRPYAASGPGTYSACDEELTLNMQLGVGDGAGGVQGYFNVLYQVVMER